MDKSTAYIVRHYVSMVYAEKNCMSFETKTNITYRSWGRYIIHRLSNQSQ